jgi:hypothetical protein
LCGVSGGVWHADMLVHPEVGAKPAKKAFAGSLAGLIDPQTGRKLANVRE